MIERLYVDNYRTLVNCEIRFEAVSLLLGPNGTGKSTVFDVIAGLRRFVGGVGQVSDFFPPSDLTRWQSLDEQQFELGLRSEIGAYRYTLRVAHTKDRRQSRVLREVLELDGEEICRLQEGNLRVVLDDLNGAALHLPFDPTRSGVAAIATNPGATKFAEFKRMLAGILCLRPCPQIMETDSREEAEELERSGSNFPSWYRFISRLDIAKQLDLFAELRQAIDGFEALRLEGPADSTATMRVMIRPAGAPSAISYKLGELSDGQRQLILLHAILFGMSDPTRVLLLDEPDNYVALSEVEPWLTALIDAAGRTIGQALVISHHPEVEDHLAREKGIWFSRDSGGPTRVEDHGAQDTAPLKPSELVARGW